MTILHTLIGLAAGAAVMFLARDTPLVLWLVPISVSIGPVLMRARGLNPSRTFVTVYVVAATIIFAAMAWISPGFRNNFDPP